MAAEHVELDWKPGNNGHGIMRATIGGDVILVEKIDLARGKQRKAFVEALVKKRANIDAPAVAAALLDKAHEETSKPDAEPGDAAALPELDAGAIVRPERIITREVSGLSIPTMTADGDDVFGQWLLYLRWQDGRREAIKLPRAIDLPGDGGRLWIHPDPAEPSPTTRAGWSADARRRWLDGDPAPSAADVFKAVAERVAYFLDLPRDEAPGVTATLTAWVLLTYCYHAWPAVPYLFIGGALGSGKSRVFEVLSRLVFRALGSSNMSAAAMFRTLHASGGTLLLDESERLRDTRDPGVSELLSMLLAGYKKGGEATRLEPIGDKGFRTVSFDVFGPKGLACISGLPPALASRCIPITMLRAAPDSAKPRRRIDAEPQRWEALRDALHALALEHGGEWLDLAARIDVCPAGLSGRDFELWQPILAIGAFVESTGARGLLGLLQEHALRVIDSGRDEQTPDHDETLLKLLSEAVRCGERVTPGELAERAKQAEPEAFKRWTAHAVRSHLARYGLTPSKSAGRKVYSRVTLADLVRIQRNYGFDLNLAEDFEL